MMTTKQTVSFNDAQLELIQLFAGGLTDSQLKELKDILLDFKFKRATALADAFVDERNWTSEDVAVEAESIKRRSYQHAQR